MDSSRSQYTITLDDDPMVHRMIEMATGMQSISFSSISTFQSRAERYEPLALFVDVDLGPEANGLSLIPGMRTRWPHCPIIVVTATVEGDTVAHALAAGANDFVRKPIDPKELLARFRARSLEMDERLNRDVICVSDIEIDMNTNRLSGPDGISYLSRSDIKALAHIAQAKGVVVTRDELRWRIWGGLQVSNNALDKKIHEIRRALRSVSSQVQLQTAYGRGVSLIVSSVNEIPAKQAALSSL